MNEYPLEIKTTVELPEMERLKALLKKHRAIVEEMDINLQNIEAARLRLELKINQPAFGAPADLLSNVE